MSISRILFVDDDPDIRYVGAAALQRSKLDVSVAESGAEALALAARVRPDVILLDVMMPELDGLETLVRLRADPVTAAIPVIFVTGKVLPDELAALRAAGAVGIIVKPFDVLRLAEQVKAMLAGAAP